MSLMTVPFGVRASRACSMIAACSPFTVSVLVSVMMITGSVA
jgi:hypothetical protein